MRINVSGSAIYCSQLSCLLLRPKEFNKFWNFQLFCPLAVMCSSGPPVIVACGTLYMILGLLRVH